MSAVCWLGFQVAHTINLHQEQYWWTEPQGMPIHHIHPGNVSETQRAVGQGPPCSDSTTKKWPQSGLVTEEITLQESDGILFSVLEEGGYY